MYVCIYDGIQSANNIMSGFSTCNVLKGMQTNTKGIYVLRL